MMRYLQIFAGFIILNCVLCHGDARAGGFVAPSSGNLYASCVGGTAAAVSQFGLGSSQSNFVPSLTGLPVACPTSEVLLGTVTAGQTVQFGISTAWAGTTFWAFSNGTDQASLVAFGDVCNSLGLGGSIFQQTSSTTWVMHLNDAAHYTISQCAANNMLIQLRLAVPPAVPMIMPQFAFGGGWYSALYFTNTGTASVSFGVNFLTDDGVPLTVPSQGGSAASVKLAPHATAIIEAPNNGPLNEGYASFSLPSGVTGYGVFRQSVPGIADQEAVVPFYPASSATARLTWDDTTYETTIAIVNLSSVSNSIAVTAWDSSGLSFAGTTLPIAAQSKITAALRDLLPVGTIVGKRGTALFTVPAGSIAVLGLRFNGAAFTSIPAVGQ